jgi:aspartate/methionine/tyrosine aminotransferase
VQQAAPALIAAGLNVRASIDARLRQNLESVRRAVRHAPALTLHEPDGGWSIVLRVPAILSEEQWVLHLLEEDGVLVHPGFFFDIETGVHLVISLLPLPHLFEAGISRIAAMASEAQA